MKKRSSFLNHQAQMRSPNSKLCDVMPNQTLQEDLEVIRAEVIKAVAFCDQLHRNGSNMRKAVGRIQSAFPVLTQEGAKGVVQLWKEHRESKANKS